MRSIEGVVFDFIGTLTNLDNYSLETSKTKLCQAVEAEFRIDAERFEESYNQAYERFQTVRMEKLVEVTNSIWISEALKGLGVKIAPEDQRIENAVNVYFENYLSSLRLRRCGKHLLRRLSGEYKLGVASNFTYELVPHAGLKRLRIKQYFDTVVVSHEVGWRKPHPRIFAEIARRLGIPINRLVFVGDSPVEDIGGARHAGMKTVFVSSQFHPIEDLQAGDLRADLAVRNLCELSRNFEDIVGEVSQNST